MTKEKKQRAVKYEERLALNGTFEGLIKITVTDKHNKDAKKKANAK